MSQGSAQHDGSSHQTQPDDFAADSGCVPSLHDASEETLLTVLRQAQHEFQEADTSDAMLARQRESIGQALKSRGDVWSAGDVIVLQHESLGDTCVPLETLPCTLGKGRRADVTIYHPEISRIHCRLERIGVLVRVKDQGMSKNGTFLNDEKILAEDLAVGDRLRFGSQTFIVLRRGQ